jgi:outer membrane receptor protein involved in Fe transport
MCVVCFDVQASYRMDFENLGILDIVLTYGHLFSYEEIPFQGADVDDSTGEIGYADHEVVLGLIYNVGPATVALTTQWISESEFDNDPNGFLYGASVPDQFFTDFQGRWRFNDSMELVLGVDNVFDEYVEIGFSTFLAANTDLNATGWNTAPDVYDGYGRRYYAGFKVNF